MGDLEVFKGSSEYQVCVSDFILIKPLHEFSNYFQVYYIEVLASFAHTCATLDTCLPDNLVHELSDQSSVRPMVLDKDVKTCHC